MPWPATVHNGAVHRKDTVSGMTFSPAELLSGEITRVVAYLDLAALDELIRRIPLPV